MKKVLVMMVAALTLTTAANAQNDNDNQKRQRPNKTEMIQKRTDHMVERYGLNKEQAAQLLKVNTTYDGQMMGGPMGGPRGSRMGGPGQRPERRDSVERQRPSKEQMETMRKDMETKMEAYKAEVKKIMTDEQFAKYEEDLKNFRPGRKPNND